MNAEFTSKRSPGLPVVLHKLLDDAEREGNDHIVCWSADGKAFKVHDREAFTQQLMPRYFETSTWKSYQRNINIWNFNTIRKGVDKGFSSHEFFRKGDIEGCKQMKRVRVKGTGKARRVRLATSSTTKSPLPPAATSQKRPTLAIAHAMPQSNPHHNQRSVSNRESKPSFVPESPHASAARSIANALAFRRLFAAGARCGAQVPMKDKFLLHLLLGQVGWHDELLGALATRVANRPSALTAFQQQHVGLEPALEGLLRLALISQQQL